MRAGGFQDLVRTFSIPRGGRDVLGEYLSRTGLAAVTARHRRGKSKASSIPRGGHESLGSVGVAGEVGGTHESRGDPGLIRDPSE